MLQYYNINQNNGVNNKYSPSYYSFNNSNSYKTGINQSSSYMTPITNSSSSNIQQPFTPVYLTGNKFNTNYEENNKDILETNNINESKFKNLNVNMYNNTSYSNIFSGKTGWFCVLCKNFNFESNINYS